MSSKDLKNLLAADLDNEDEEDGDFKPTDDGADETGKGKGKQGKRKQKTPKKAAGKKRASKKSRGGDSDNSGSDDDDLDDSPDERFRELELPPDEYKKFLKSMEESDDDEDDEDDDDDEEDSEFVLPTPRKSQRNAAGSSAAASSSKAAELVQNIDEEDDEDDEAADAAALADLEQEENLHELYKDLTKPVSAIYAVGASSSGSASASIEGADSKKRARDVAEGSSSNSVAAKRQRPAPAGNVDEYFNQMKDSAASGSSSAADKPSGVAVQQAKSNRIEDILAKMQGKKESTLKQSRRDWDKFKDDNKLNDELKHAQQTGFLEKQAFLDRAELREFEHDRDLRNAERLRKELQEKR